MFSDGSIHCTWRRRHDGNVHDSAKPQPWTEVTFSTRSELVACGLDHNKNDQVRFENCRGFKEPDQNASFSPVLRFSAIRSGSSTQARNIRENATWNGCRPRRPLISDTVSHSPAVMVRRYVQVISIAECHVCASTLKRSQYCKTKATGGHSHEQPPTRRALSRGQCISLTVSAVVSS